LRNILAATMASIMAIVALVVPVAGALAAPIKGQPVPWQIGLQPAATPVMAEMNAFHNMLLVIITAIALFVLALMIYVMVRFNAKRNPVPTTNTHNTMLEVLWTVIPIIILVVIAVPSFRLLYYQDTVPEADMTIKAIGQSWQWEYEYPDEGLSFTSFMLDREDAIAAGEPALLAVDEKVVVPVGKIIRLQITSDDVIHSWAVPAFGVKMDAVPGRLNETWFLVEEPGIYYGQCSELCGQNHAFMPIAVEAMLPEDYEAWLVIAREQYARRDDDSAIDAVQVTAAAEAR
jgi:cytochrome c oxidase subunit 2